MEVSGLYFRNNFLPTYKSNIHPEIIKAYIIIYLIYTII